MLTTAQVIFQLLESGKKTKERDTLKTVFALHYEPLD